MKTPKMGTLCLLAAGLLLSGKIAAQEGSWLVQDVSDGDRMVLGFKSVRQDGSAGIEAKPARLAGIQCPNPGQRFFAYGKAFTEVALGGRFKGAKVKVLINTGPRWVVDFINPGGDSLCQELLKNGLAWAQPTGLSLPEEREYSQSFPSLEDQARKAQAGLWSEPNPVPPWKFVAQLPAGTAGPTDGEIQAGKVDTSGLRPKLSPPGTQGQEPDVTTKVMELMKRKTQMLDQLVQQRSNSGAPGDYLANVRQLDQWTESELERIFKEESPREASVITRKLAAAPPQTVLEPPPTGLTALGEDPFVKDKVNDLMKQEVEMIQPIVEARNHGCSEQEFEAALRKVDQWEDAQVAQVVKVAFLHKQELVIRDLDRTPWNQERDWQTWDYTPFRRDVFDQGRWIGRVVQDRNGHIVWYDRPDGSPHWIRNLGGP